MIVLLLIASVLVGGLVAVLHYGQRRRELEVANTRRGAGLSAIARGVLGGLATSYTGGLSLARSPSSPSSSPTGAAALLADPS